MRLSDILDSPIAFHRSFVALGVGVTGAVMLSQAMYWSKRTRDSEGWFYKSQDEWEQETGLTRYEQEGARKKLRAIGILEEARKGAPARLFYRVNTAQLLVAFQIAEKPHSSLQKGDATECGKTTDKNVEYQQPSQGKTSRQDAGNSAISHTEITTETTTEITAETTGRGAGVSPPSVLSEQKRSEQNENAQPLPDWIPADAWVAFVEMRKSLGSRGKLTANAAKLIIKELEKLAAQGNDPRTVLEQSVINNWRGVFALKGNTTGKQAALETRNRQVFQEFAQGFDDDRK